MSFAAKTIRIVAILVIVQCFIDESQSWYRRRRRRRRSCYPVNCQVSSWSSWSACGARQCGVAGYKRRTRSILTGASCGGSGCPSLQQLQVCHGSTAANCVYSTWSKWSPCTQCGDVQTSRRHIITKGQCGGTSCNVTALHKTRACQTHCLNQGNVVDVQCSCHPGYRGSCCLYHGRSHSLVSLN